MIYPPGHRKKGERDAAMNGHDQGMLWLTLTVDGCFMVWVTLASKKHTIKNSLKNGMSLFENHLVLQNSFDRY